MPLLNITLPPNLCADKSNFGKSVYWVDYCSKSNRLFRNSQSTRGRQKSWKPLLGNVAYPMSDHYPPPSVVGKQIITSPTIGPMSEKKKEVTFEKKERTLSESSSPTPPTHAVSDVRPPLVGQSGTTVYESLPDTMNEIRASWEKAASATKRDRGWIYAEDIKKERDGQTVKRDKMLAPKGLPGLDNWLTKANEYEKQVVYSFMTTVSNATPLRRPESAPATTIFTTKSSSRESTPSTATPRPKSTPSRGRVSPNPKMSAHIKQYRPASAHSNGFSRETSLKTGSEHGHSNNRNPSPPQSARPASHGSHHQRHHHIYNHDDVRCAKCRDSLVKDIVKEMRRGYETGNKPYNFLLDKDYVHNLSVFNNNGNTFKDHFIVHPDWISETKTGGISLKR